jgi:hypothetical protein
LAAASAHELADPTRYPTARVRLVKPLPTETASNWSAYQRKWRKHVDV